MKTIFLVLITIFSQIAGASDFGELVEKYVKMNQDKISIIANHKHRIKGVEIIIADKAEAMASRFGHGMLRLVDDDNTWVNDPVISFSALSFDENYSLGKSIFGGYGVTPQVMSFFEFWNMYTEKEERDLKRYVINLNEDQLQSFLTVLFKYLHNPALIDKYTFMSNNCIGVITKMFVEAKLTKKKSTSKIPVNVGPWIEKNGLSFYPEFVMKNNSGIKSKMATVDINGMSETDLTETFSYEELKYIVYNFAELSEEKTDFIAALIRNKGQNLDDTYSFNPVHYSLYQDISQEQDHLRNDDLKRTIVHRLNKKMSDKVQHLNYELKTLARVDLNGVDFGSYKMIQHGNDVQVILSLGSSKTRSKKDIILKNRKIDEVVFTENHGMIELSSVILR